MTVVVQTPYNSHTANGVTTTFGFTFQLLDAEDLQVSVDGVVQLSGFSISGIGVQAGGSITFAVAPANGALVEIQRSIPLARGIDYQQNGDLPSDTVDLDFDRLWQALQDQQYFAGLTVGLPAGDIAAPMVLPSVAERANSFFAFNALGEAIAALGVPDVPVSAFAATLLDDADAAEARATLAAAKSGANIDITSLGGLTTPLSQAQGGTGVSSGLRVDVASAATVVIPTTTNNVQITGSTGPITGFTIAAGRVVFVRFTGTPTLTNNASIVTQAGANITVQANDTCILRATAENVVEVLAYTRAYSGTAPIRVYQGNLSGAAIRELTGIPSWARKIVVEYWAASTNGANSVPGIEIGPSGYGGTGASVTSATLNGVSPVVATAAVPTPLLNTSWDQNVVAYGKAEFEFVGSTGSAERWIATLTGLRADNSATVSSTAHITFASGVVVDRVRMTSRSADQWDAGEWAVSIYP